MPLGITKLFGIDRKHFMRKILIIEDEPLAVDKLRDYLKKYRPHYEIVADIDSVEYAVEWLINHPAPDLLFVDIQLADGLSFDIFKKIKVDAPMIFVTAYDRFAIQAFQQNSVAYILKPYEYQELVKAIDKFEANFGTTTTNNTIDLEMLEAAMQRLANKYKQRFVVKNKDRLLSIATHQVQAFLSEDKYTMLVDTAGKKHFIQYRLDQLVPLLDPKQFYRISRKYIINIDFLKEVIAYSGSRLKVVLKAFPQEDLIVSREKVSDFKEWLRG